jgi:hypothetical protein
MGSQDKPNERAAEAAQRRGIPLASRLNYVEARLTAALVVPAVASSQRVFARSLVTHGAHATGPDTTARLLGVSDGSGVGYG